MLEATVQRVQLRGCSPAQCVVEGRSPMCARGASFSPMRVPGEVEHELFVALGLARTTLARHAYALVAAGAAHLHKGSLGDGVEVRRALVEVLQERGLSVGVERGCNND